LVWNWFPQLHHGHQIEFLLFIWIKFVKTV